MRLGTFTWQLPNHRKKRKERRQRRKTKKKKTNSAQLAAVHYQDKKMERAQTGERTQQAQRSISSSCGLLWRLRPEAERWLSGSSERALGKDDHCAASVAGIFLSKGKQVGASFTLDAAGGRFSDDLSSFFSGNQSPLWKSWNVGLVLLPLLFTLPTCAATTHQLTVVSEWNPGGQTGKRCFRQLGEDGRSYLLEGGA